MYIKKEDARTLSSAEQELIRREVVRMKKQGNSFISISKVVSIHRNTVSEIWQLYKSKGISGLVIKKRGRKKGEKQRLDKEQEKRLRKLILDKSPEQYKLTACLMDKASSSRTNKADIWNSNAYSHSRRIFETLEFYFSKTTKTNL